MPSRSAFSLAVRTIEPCFLACTRPDHNIFVAFTLKLANRCRAAYLPFSVYIAAIARFRREHL